MIRTSKNVKEYLEAMKILRWYVHTVKSMTSCLGMISNSGHSPEFESIRGEVGPTMTPRHVR